MANIPKTAVFLKKTIPFFNLKTNCTYEKVSSTVSMDEETYRTIIRFFQACEERSEEVRSQIIIRTRSSPQYGAPSVPAKH